MFKDVLMFLILVIEHSLLVSSYIHRIAVVGHSYVIYIYYADNEYMITKYIFFLYEKPQTLYSLILQLIKAL